MMSTYLERYVAGEHERVWAELVALGGAVREEPVYTDARMVARETMRRVRANIETLIERLLALGYQFGYDGRDPEIAAGLQLLNADRSTWPAILQRHAAARRPPPRLDEPAPDSAEALIALQVRYGALPLSLVAWYEAVGGVNLVGSFPVADPLDPEGFNDLYQYRAACANSHMDRYHLPARDLDPLWVYSLGTQEVALSFQEDVGGSFEVNGARGYILYLAPHEREKQGFGPAAESLSVIIPDTNADARLLTEWYDLTFVEYLRLCFRWGGFPGVTARARPPLRELALLTAGLLPI